MGGELKRLGKGNGSTDANKNKGGLHQYETLAERNDIPLSLRRKNMRVSVLEGATQLAPDGKLIPIEYILTGLPSGDLMGTGDQADVWTKAIAVHAYLLTDPIGTETYGSDPQALIDNAPSGSVLTLFANIPTTVTHRNAVVINTNGYTIARINDSDSSGKFSIEGDGAVNRLNFVNGTTDCTLEAQWDSSNLDMAYDNNQVINCKRLEVHKPILLNGSTYVYLGGATDFYANGGMYSPEKSRWWKITLGETGGWYLVRLAGSFTGHCVVMGDLITAAYHTNFHLDSYAGGLLLLVDVNLINTHPGGENSNELNSCINYSSYTCTTKIVFRGKNMMMSTKFPIRKSTNANLPYVDIDVEGELFYNIPSQDGVRFFQKTPNSLATDYGTRTAYDAQTPIEDSDIAPSQKGTTKLKWTFLQLYNYVKGKLDSIYARLSGFNSFTNTSFDIAEFVREGPASARIKVRNSSGTLSTIMDANSTTGSAFGSETATDVSYVTGQVTKLRIFHATGNILIQNGGTMTDGGYRLDIQGTQRVTGNITQGTVLITSGSGSPEGVVTAPVGSTYSRTDGGANTARYLKESGVGNTGWIAK